jgi:hypothetical protein
MSGPLEFLDIFVNRLKEAKIRFAITSGMACVHYGLQQNTKDSDWIFCEQDVELLRDFLIRIEGELPPWRVCYRPVFGAPMDRKYLSHGWTCHLAVWNKADSPENHVDLFCSPPRVMPEEIVFNGDLFASRHVVAQMKKTDREKDWPIVDGLGLQDWIRKRPEGVLHIRSVPQLCEAWADCPLTERPAMAKIRPLLGLIETVSTMQLERLLLIERQIWQCVNRERYGVYQKEWKAFYRRWQAALDWAWPVSEPFWMQHERIVKAAARFGLPDEPIRGDEHRHQLYELGIQRAAALTGASPFELTVKPPIQIILP